MTKAVWRFLVVLLVLFLGLGRLATAVQAQAPSDSGPVQFDVAREPQGDPSGRPNSVVELDGAPTGHYSPDGVQFQWESEPNNLFTEATPLTGPKAAVQGNIYPNADVDWYSFTGAAGDRVYAATMTSFSASGNSDSQLRLYGSDGTTLIEFDDNDGSFGTGSSSIAGATLPGAGTYYLEVRANSPTAQIRPYSLYLQLRGGTPTAEIEPNNSAATAQPLPSLWASGAVTPAGDTDWYAIELNAGDTVFVSLDADPERDGVTWNPRLGIGIFDGFILLVNDANTVSPNSEAHFMTVKDAGTYVLYVDNTSATVAGDSYHLSISVFPHVPEGLACTTYSSTDVPKTISDGAPSIVTSTLTVPGNPIIADLDVSIQLTHSFMQDLDVALISPENNQNGLFTDVGNATVGGPSNMNLVLDDEAGIPIGSFTVVGGMRYRPELNYRLDWFDGEDAGGTWTLRIADDATGDGGELTGWSITICEQPPAPVCAPGTIPTVLYSSDFEADDGGFTHSGTLDEWERGTPTYYPIDTCNSGTSCWVTDLDNTYDASSSQDLYSPDIDLSNVLGPVTVTWWQRYQMESATFDHAWVDAEEVGGPTVNRLWEWYGATMTTAVGNPSVTLQESAGWGRYERDLTGFLGDTMRLRYHVDGDSTVNFAGLGVDDVTVTACLPGPTPTPTATATNTPTNTPVPPTATATNTPTNTPVLPTATATGTATPQPAGTYCSTAPLPIPDGNPTGVTQTITVPDSGALTDLDVFLDVTHTWLGDTQFTLEHNGTTVNMFDRPGVPASTFGCSGDNINNWLDDEGTLSAENSCGTGNPAYPAGARLIPNSPLSAFDGMDRSGTWTITARDFATPDPGTLNQWCLSFTPPVGEPTATATSVPPTATNTPVPPTVTNTPVPPTMTATTVPPVTPSPTGPPTSIELGSIGAEGSGGAGWLLSLAGLALVAAGMIARRRR